MWGCDEPTLHPQVVFTCPACRGAGCGHCTGGKARIYDCPQRLVTRHDWAVFKAFVQFDKGMLPASVGFHEHAATFVQAMEYLSQLKAAKENDEIKEAKRKAEAAARKNR